jgi:hemolysin-activating ACP:hemolysin acyltransferase
MGTVEEFLVSYPYAANRLSAAPRYPIRLHPNEWQSGEAIWIVDAVGESKAVQQCIEALAKTAFQGNEFKMLSASDKATAEPVKRNTRQATGA